MTNENNEVTFEIKEHLGVLGTDNRGWNKELNIVEWNQSGYPKYDIRSWSPDHTKMTKGITLLDKEMDAIVALFTARNHESQVYGDNRFPQRNGYGR